jgi:hypothetical protein
MRLIARVALVLAVVAVVSALAALAWDRSERAAAQPAAVLGPH